MSRTRNSSLSQNKDAPESGLMNEWEPQSGLSFDSSLFPKNLSSFVLRSGGRNATISDVCHIVTNYVFCLSVYFLSARRGVFPLLLGIPLRRDLMVNLYLCGCTTYFMLHNG